MSKLEELIQELCPNGVEYLELSECIHYAKDRISSKNINESTYVSVENLLQNKMGKTFANSVPKNGNVIAFQTGDILIGNIRPYLRKIWLADCNGGTNGDVLAIQVNDKSILSSEYLYYILSSEQFFIFYIQTSKGAKMPRGDKYEMMKYRIPVPPIEVQREIVRILDSFTELTTELKTKLTTELSARKKQYEYYRDSLLNNPLGKIEEMTIGDIYSFQYGKGNRIPEGIGKYPVYGSNGVVGSFEEYNSEDSPVIGHIGAYAGIVNWAAGKHFVTYNGVICKCINDKVVSKYGYYLLLMQDYISMANSGSQPFVSYDILNKPIVKVPSYKEQMRIVAILDKFDALCSDLSEGLPAEIDARQKQYEYYRDKLLSFKNIAS